MCAAGSHINVDETGAAERILGAKLIDVPCPDGKLVPEQLDELTWMIGDIHHVQPGVLSITQSTELGTVYTPDEVAVLCAAAHDLGMRVHVDGARLANATAALGGDRNALRSFTVDAGVDVLTFGGTKNGLLGAEAVVFLDPVYAERAGVPPQTGQPAGLQDALHRRPVPRPPPRRPLARPGHPGQRVCAGAVPGHGRHRRCRPRRARPR